MDPGRPPRVSGAYLVVREPDDVPEKTASWLSRFEDGINTEFYQCFDHAWRPVVHLEAGLVCALRPADRVEICVRLHPGMSALDPNFAARRLVGGLREAVTRAGHLPPLVPGNQPLS